MHRFGVDITRCAHELWIDARVTRLRSDLCWALAQPPNTRGAIFWSRLDAEGRAILQLRSGQHPSTRDVSDAMLAEAAEKRCTPAATRDLWKQARRSYYGWLRLERRDTDTRNLLLLVIPHLRSGLCAYAGWK